MYVCLSLIYFWSLTFGFEAPFKHMQNRRATFCIQVSAFYWGIQKIPTTSLSDDAWVSRGFGASALPPCHYYSTTYSTSLFSSTVATVFHHTPPQILRFVSAGVTAVNTQAKTNKHSISIKFNVPNHIKRSHDILHIELVYAKLFICLMIHCLLADLIH